jgi:hypothetical protein
MFPSLSLNPYQIWALSAPLLVLYHVSHRSPQYASASALVRGFGAHPHPELAEEMQTYHCATAKTKAATKGLSSKLARISGAQFRGLILVVDR